MKGLRCIVGGFPPMRRKHRRRHRGKAAAPVEATDNILDGKSSISSYRSISMPPTSSSMPVELKPTEHENLEEECTQDNMLHFAILEKPHSKKITRRHTADMGSLFDSDDEQDDDETDGPFVEGGDQRPGLLRSKSTPIKIGPEEDEIVNASRIWQFVPKIKAPSKSRRHSICGPRTPLSPIPEPAAAMMPRRHSTIGYMSWGNGAEDQSVAISSVASEVTGPGGFDSFSSIEENLNNRSYEKLNQTTTSTEQNLDDLFSSHSGEQRGGGSPLEVGGATQDMIGGEVQFRSLYQDDTKTRSVSKSSDVSSPPPSLSIVSSDEEMYDEDSIFSDDSTVRTGHNSFQQDALSSSTSQQQNLRDSRGTYRAVAGEVDAVSKSSKSSSLNSLYSEEEEEDGETSTQSPSSEEMSTNPQNVPMDTMYDCIKALSLLDEAKVITTALKRLQKCLTDDPDTVWYFVGAYGGIPQTVKAMHHCVDSPSIQSDSIALFCRIVDGSKRFASQLLEAGAVDRMLDAVGNFPVHRSIHYNSAGLMKRLAGALKGEHLHRLCSVCTPSVLQSLKMFDSDMRMQKALGTVLWFFAEEEECRSLILEMGGADGITNSLLKGVDLWKISFLTLYQRLVQDHAKGHPCYTSSNAHQKCPFYG